MNTYEIAEFLNKKGTDEQFAEVFALLGLMMYGIRVSEIYNSEIYNAKTIILNMNVDSVCNALKTILKQIQKDI